MFRRVVGQPVRPRMDLLAQRRRTMSRCERRIVSGVTSSARSAHASFGRAAGWRCRTRSWWRRIRISAIFHAPSRRDSRSHAVTRVIKRKDEPEAHDR